MRLYDKLQDWWNKRQLNKAIDEVIIDLNGWSREDLEWAVMSDYERRKFNERTKRNEKLAGVGTSIGTSVVSAVLTVVILKMLGL